MESTRSLVEGILAEPEALARSLVLQDLPSQQILQALSFLTSRP